jgi:hypothetical protein
MEEAFEKRSAAAAAASADATAAAGNNISSGENDSKRTKMTTSNILTILDENSLLQVLLRPVAKITMLSTTCVAAFTAFWILISFAKSVRNKNLPKS